MEPTTLSESQSIRCKRMRITEYEHIKVDILKELKAMQIAFNKADSRFAEGFGRIINLLK